MHSVPTTNEALSTSTRPWDVTAVCIALAGCFFALLHFLTKAALHSPSLLVTPYWVSFFELSYGDGFRRRALMGSLLRAAEPGGGSVVLINVFAALVLAGLLVVYLSSFVRKMQRTSWAYVFTFGFFMSALISVLFEVMGDLLQTAILLFVVVAWFAVHHVRSRPAALVLLLVALVPCFLIHEAAVFFLAPCLPFLFYRSPGLKQFVMLGIAPLVIFLAWSTAWNAVHPHLTYHLNLLHGGTHLDTKETFGTPTFRELLHQLYGVHFAGARGKVNFLLKVLKVAALVLGGWIAMSLIFPKSLVRRQLFLYTTLMICSLPLWVIAADWGRFSAYYFFLTIVLTSWRPFGQPTVEAVPAFVERMEIRLHEITGSTLVRIAALFALVESPFFASRIYGMDLRSLLCVLALSTFAAAQLKGWISDVQIPERREAA